MSVSKESSAAPGRRHHLERVSTTEVPGTMWSRLISPPHARWSWVAEWSARSRARTVSQVSLLILAVTTAGIALLAFLLDLIVNDPVSVAAMLVIVILAVILDLSLDPPTNLGS
jgi:hypothetical protein